MIAGITVGVIIAAACTGVTCLGFIYVFLKAAKKKKFYNNPSRNAPRTNYVPPAQVPRATPPKPMFMKTVQTQKEVIILKK